MTYRTDRPEKAPELPTDDDMFRLQARVDAYGSDAVKVAMASWLDARSEFVRVSTMMRTKQKAVVQENLSADYAELHKTRDLLKARAETVKQAAVADLRY